MTMASRFSSPAFSGARVPDWIERAGTGFAAAIGLWTLLCHAVVYARGGLSILAPLGLLAIPAAVAVTLLLSPRRVSPVRSGGEMPGGEMLGVRRAVLLLAALPVAGYAVTGSFLAYWAGACLLLAAGWLLHLRPAAPLLPVAPREPRGAGWIVGGLMTLCALTYLVVLRPNGDDPFYLSVAAGALDFPDEPLLRFDHMHDVPGLRILLPIYQVQSLELLAAAVARLTGLSHVLAMNLWLPTLYAAMVVVAAAALLRLLLPRRWLAATAMTAALVVVMTALSAGFGNTSLGRIQQGKPVFVAILMPLAMVAAARFSMEGGWRAWVLLALTQVACVGATSTALWAAPLAAGLVLAGGWVPTRAATLRLLAGAIASLYPVAAALLYSGVMRALVSVAMGTEPIPIEQETVFQFGVGWPAWLFLWSIAAAWTIPGDPARRRLVAAGALGLLLVFYNPFLMRFWAQNVTGVPTFGRVWWSVPRHVWLAMMVLAPAVLAGGKPALRPVAATVAVGGGGAVAAGILAVFAFVAVPGPLYPKIEFNDIAWRWPPEAKVPPERRRIIASAVAGLPPGSVVLAPYRLAPWIAIDRGHPGLVAISHNYLNQLETAFGRDETERRRRLLRYMDGIAREPELLARSLDELRIDVVVAEAGNPHLESIRAVCAAAGWAEEEVEDYRVFRRAPAARS